MRFAKGSGAVAGFGFAVAVAMFFSILPGLNSNGIGPLGKKGNWEANGRFSAFCNCHTIKHIEGMP
jgi:hypothetical protein